jgi:hypothetical protein
MTNQEIRMRCVEAAAKQGHPHRDGPAAGALETASAWFDWIVSEPRPAAGEATLVQEASMLY